MRQRALERGNPDCHQTTARGLAVLSSPLLNKGTAFAADERTALGLTGLLPPDISTLAIQVKRAYIQYESLSDSLSKNIYLTALHDRNEILFYRLFSEHLWDMIPVVSDVPLGMAIKQNFHECRRPRGVYLSIDHPNLIEEAFANLGVGEGDIDIILATDAEQIPGLGDCGVGGIEVAIGKLAIYTAAGGIDPARTIPVVLDVGTNRESLLADPTYPGNRHPRIRGPRYDAFIDAYVETVKKLFPGALLQWEAFAPENGRRIMQKYGKGIRAFSEDLQGTAVTGFSAAISAVRVCGTPFRNQRVVVFGAGAAGMGVADQIHKAMMREGATREAAARCIWCVDSAGLLTSDMPDLLDFQVPYARPAAEMAAWRRSAGDKMIGLADVVRRVRPTMLIGASSLGGSFTEQIVRDMASHTERPIIFPLSSSAGRCEANPGDLIAWTDGRALIATGSAFAPVTYKGVTYVIAQLNNAMLYPGLVLGAIVSRALRISGGMLVAAARAVSSLVAVRLPGASLLPHIDDLRTVAVSVAVAVAESAREEGLSRVRFDDIVQQVQDAMWRPEYRRLVAA